MSSLSFPDVNVWLALLLADHVHRDIAIRWWEEDRSETIGFSRITQLSILRLLTTPAAMNGKPLSMRDAWRAYDRLFEDSRVAFLSEPTSLDPVFRQLCSSAAASPKVWADAYMVAFAAKAKARLVTFDRALHKSSRNAQLLC